MITRSGQVDIINHELHRTLGKPVNSAKTFHESRHWLMTYDLSLILYEIHDTGKAISRSKSPLTLSKLMQGVSDQLVQDYTSKHVFTLYGLLARGEHHTGALEASQQSQYPTQNASQAVADPSQRPSNNNLMQTKDPLVLQLRQTKPTNKDKAVAAQCSQIIHYSPQTIAKIVHICVSAGYRPEDVICAIYIYRNSMRRHALNGRPITAPAKYILGVVKQLMPGDAENIIYQIRLQDKKRQVPKSIWRGMHDKRSGDYDDLIYFYGWGECYHAYQYQHSTPPLTLTGKIYLYDKQAVFDYEPVDKSTQLRVAVLFRNALVQLLHSHRVSDLINLTPQAIQKIVDITKQQCDKATFHRDESGHEFTIGVDLGKLRKNDVATAIHYVKVTAKRIKQERANPENLSYPTVKKYQAFAKDKSIPSDRRALNSFIVGCLYNLNRDYKNAKEIPTGSKSIVFLQGDLCGQAYHTITQLKYIGFSEDEIIKAFQKVTQKVKNPYDVMPTLKGLFIE